VNELIPITTNETGEPVVSGRALHGFLDVDTPYTMWFDRKREYGFSESEDFITVLLESRGGRPSVDHALKLDMAKELCMLERNERGKQARQYFIQVDKDWNSPEKVMARALKIAERTLASLRIEASRKDSLIAELKPKAAYVDHILQNPGTVNINAIAKDYGMSGVKLNALLHGLGVQYSQDKQWLLYAKHQDMGYTHSQTIEYQHKDGTPDVQLHTQWTQKGRLFLYELLKETGVVPMIERTGEVVA
jgi:anti-repressor protein